MSNYPYGNQYFGRAPPLPPLPPRRPLHPPNLYGGPVPFTQQDFISPGPAANSPQFQGYGRGGPSPPPQGHWGAPPPSTSPPYYPPPPPLPARPFSSQANELPTSYAGPIEDLQTPSPYGTSATPTIESPPAFPNPPPGSYAPQVPARVSISSNDGLQSFSSPTQHSPYGKTETGYLGIGQTQYQPPPPPASQVSRPSYGSDLRPYGNVDPLLNQRPQYSPPASWPPLHNLGEPEVQSEANYYLIEDFNAPPTQRHDLIEVPDGPPPPPPPTHLPPSPPLAGVAIPQYQPPPPTSKPPQQLVDLQGFNAPSDYGPSGLLPEFPPPPKSHLIPGLYVTLFEKLQSTLLPRLSSSKLSTKSPSLSILLVNASGTFCSKKRFLLRKGNSMRLYH
jgi:hypothetical protein